MDDLIFCIKRARDGTRTRDPHLGKVVLHQLSHSRISVLLRTIDMEEQKRLLAEQKKKQEEQERILAEQKKKQQEKQSKPIEAVVVPVVLLLLG